LSFKPANRERVLLTNVQGTKNALALAERLKCAFFYVSTAYVHDKRGESVGKEVPVIRHRFDSAYEESKYLAEELVFESKAMYVIFRPSILLSSIDDKSRNVFGYYAVAIAISSALRTIRSLPMLIVRRDSILNLIPVKQATAWMVSIAGKFNDKSPKIFQITNPKPLRLDEVLRATLDGFGLNDLKIVRVGGWLAQTVLYATSILLCFIKKFRKTSKILSYYKPYLLQITQFDVTNSRSVLGKEFMRYDTNMTPASMISSIAKAIARDQK